jgi:hypothetical protein
MEVITVCAVFQARMAQYSTSAELADTRIGAGGMNAEKNARTWQRSTKGWDERGRRLRRSYFVPRTIGVVLTSLSDRTILSVADLYFLKCAVSRCDLYASASR